MRSWAAAAVRRARSAIAGAALAPIIPACQSSLPAAERTGNLTIVTDAIVHSLVHDPATGKVSGVRVIDQNTKVGKTYEAKVVFLNASTIGTGADPAQFEAARPCRAALPTGRIRSAAT